MHTRLWHWGKYGLLIVPVLVAVWVGFTVVRGMQFYDLLKQPGRRMTGGLFTGDVMLGYQPVAAASGQMLFPGGAAVPVQLDREGCRIPAKAGEAGQARKRGILFIGDSYAFGDGCAAEIIFAEQTARQLGKPACNAGVPGYGLSQLVLWGEEKMAACRPAIAVLQYSPWLAKRSAAMIAPTTTALIPAPYFFREKDDLQIHPAVFQNRLFDLPADRFESSPRSLGDRLAFLTAVAFPLYFYQDVQYGWTRWRQWTGSLPAPLQEFGLMEKWAYQRLRDQARQQGARQVVILKIGFERGATLPDWLTGGKWHMADADSLLWAHLPEKTQTAYDGAYKHWQAAGGDSVLVDHHPNERAHRLVAELLVGVIGKP